MKNPFFLSILFLILSFSNLAARLVVEKDRGFILVTPTVPTALEIFNTFGPLKMKEKDFIVIVDKNKIKSIIKDNIVYLSSTSITNEGETLVVIRKNQNVISNIFEFVIPEDDIDKDGYPDIVELGNSKSFREWFCAIADSQFYYPSDVWYDVHKDCGGLVEFAYREALKRHDKNWAKQYKFISDFSISDERSYYYPSVPLLGKRIFRIREGSFKKEAIEKDFSITASGSSIRSYCMEFIGKDIENIQKGDVLFFFKSDNLKMPSHAMIYIGPEDPDKKEGFVVYHTGPSQKTKGFIKKVKLKDLLKHPEPLWRPLPENPDFLGIYCWKILK